MDDELQKNIKEIIVNWHNFSIFATKKEENEYCIVDSWRSRKSNGARYS